MSEINLGKIIDPNSGAERDAIHVAVAPVQAGESLQPGQPIRVNLGLAFSGGTTIGIVDPFLTKPVSRGEIFWMLLFPKTVTNLRHHWSHPDFTEKDATDPRGDDECQGCD